MRYRFEEALPLHNNPASVTDAAMSQERLRFKPPAKHLFVCEIVPTQAVKIGRPISSS